jgi:hypothetical protein
MYTEIFFRGTLMKDIPEEVVELLQLLVTGDFDEEMPEHLALIPEHEFFECSRYRWIFNCSSAYFPRHATSFIEYDKYSGWDVLVNADLKNYSGEIGKFFDWIQQYVSGPRGMFLGYSLYEEDEDPILFYKDTESRWKFS